MGVFVCSFGYFGAPSPPTLTEPITTNSLYNITYDVVWAKADGFYVSPQKSFLFVYSRDLSFFFLNKTIRNNQKRGDKLLMRKTARTPCVCVCVSPCFFFRAGTKVKLFFLLQKEINISFCGCSFFLFFTSWKKFFFPSIYYFPLRWLHNAFEQVLRGEKKKKKKTRSMCRHAVSIRNRWLVMRPKGKNKKTVGPLTKIRRHTRVALVQ